MGECLPSTTVCLYPIINIQIIFIPLCVHASKPSLVVSFGMPISDPVKSNAIVQLRGRVWCELV